MLVFPELPNAPWYPVVRDIELRSFLATSPCYLSPRMYLRPKPQWNTRIAIVDSAAATSRVNRTVGTQPPAKRVRVNSQTAIRHIPSCKEADTMRTDHAPLSQVPQLHAATTDSDSAVRERQPAPLKDSDFRGTLNTDPKPPNRARRFLRNFFQVVTNNRAVLRA